MITRSTNIIKLINERAHSYATLQYILPEELSTFMRIIRQERFLPEEVDLEEDYPYTPHISLFYGLSDDDYPILKKKFKNYGELHFSILGTPTIFETPTHNVVVLPVESVDFNRVNMEVRRGTGKEPPTYKKFNPHMTLCYLKKNSPINNYTSFFSIVHGIATELDFSTENETSMNINLIEGTFNGAIL